MTNKIAKSDTEWRRQLGDEDYQITRQHGTERAFTGCYWDCKQAGVYRCKCCGEPLFLSDSKYDSGSGWPSFYRPVGSDVIVETNDSTLGMQRTEVTCARCDAHLGHVFPDGPKPTGLRYCINSASLNLSVAPTDGAEQE